MWEDQGFKVAVVALVSGISGVFSVSRISQRSELTRAGLIVGATVLVTMLALGLVSSDVFLIRYSFLGLLNGILSAVGAIGLLPYLETVFGSHPPSGSSSFPIRTIHSCGSCSLRRRERTITA